MHEDCQSESGAMLSFVSEFYRGTQGSEKTKGQVVLCAPDALLA